MQSRKRLKNIGDYTMNLRTILIFPEFDNIEIIEQIRKKYDPLAQLIRPHITIVFPFESQMSNEDLKQILQNRLKNIKPFEIELTGFSKQADQYGNYLFLNIVKGENEISAIHYLLYENELKEFDLEIPYTPHLTVGKLPSVQALEDAFQETKGVNAVFQTKVEKIAVEMIGENEESIIQFVINLEN